MDADSDEQETTGAGPNRPYPWNDGTVPASKSVFEERCVRTTLSCETVWRLKCLRNFRIALALCSANEPESILPELNLEELRARLA